MDLITKSSSEYKEMPLDDTLKFLETSIDGLSTEEADNRVKKFGYNEILETRKNSVLAFLKRYWGPMPWLLEFAMVLTIILNHYTESIIIFTLLTLNAVIGYRQSQNSQKAVELLKKKLEIEVIVLRDGKFLKKDAKDLVPGDIIMLKLGDLVPGDVTILRGELSVDESALTGEYQ